MLPQGLEHERHVVAVAASARVLADAPRETGLHLLKDAKREPAEVPRAMQLEIKFYPIYSTPRL